MNKQEGFFTKNQDKLLSIAGWAKNIAWIALVIFVLSSLGEITRFHNNANFQATLSNEARKTLTEALTESPIRTLALVFDIASTILKGIIYYLVLKGISIGLNMIVETDINYREHKENGGEL